MARKWEPTYVPIGLDPLLYHNDTYLTWSFALLGCMYMSLLLSLRYKTGGSLFVFLPTVFSRSTSSVVIFSLWLYLSLCVRSGWTRSNRKWEVVERVCNIFIMVSIIRESEPEKSIGDLPFRTSSGIRALVELFQIKNLHKIWFFPTKPNMKTLILANQSLVGQTKTKPSFSKWRRSSLWGAWRWQRRRVTATLEKISSDRLLVSIFWT